MQKCSKNYADNKRGGQLDSHPSPHPQPPNTPPNVEKRERLTRGGQAAAQHHGDLPQSSGPLGHRRPALTFKHVKWPQRLFSKANSGVISEMYG